MKLLHDKGHVKAMNTAVNLSPMEFLRDAADYFEKMADHFEKMFDELQEEADYTAAKVNIDIGCYESSLERNTACFQEILEVMEQIKSILEAPRINKKKLFNLIEQVEKEIKNQER